MTKLEQLQNEIEKNIKCAGEKGYKSVDKLVDYAKMLRNEMAERLIIFIFAWIMAGLMFYLAYKNNIPVNPIEITGSGSDQSVSFKGSIDLNIVGLFFLASPFIYMLLRKYKSTEKEIYVKEQ